MRWFVYISFGGQKNNFDRGLVRCNALIIFIGLSPRYSPHAYSTIFIMIRDAYSTTFIVIRVGNPERKQPWGRHWTPWETHVSLFPYWWIARFWIRRYLRAYCLICLIMPTADALKVPSSRASSKWRRNIYSSLSFQVSQPRLPFPGSAIQHLHSEPITRWNPCERIQREAD